MSLVRGGCDYKLSTPVDTGYVVSVIEYVVSVIEAAFPSASGIELAWRPQHDRAICIRHRFIGPPLET
jgi:hypothetical protein